MRNRRFRWAAICCALTLAAAALAACSSSGGKTTTSGAKGSSTSQGSSSAGHKVTLKFWQWVPGMDKAVALWNSTHPNIQVALQNIPSGGAGGYAKIHAALKAGNAPDLAQVEYQEIPGFLLDKGLVDLSQNGGAQYENKFVAWQWKQGEYNGKVYAIPQASGPMGFFYREDLFKQAGITK